MRTKTVPKKVQAKKTTSKAEGTARALVTFNSSTGARLRGTLSSLARSYTPSEVCHDALAVFEIVGAAIDGDERAAGILHELSRAARGVDNEPGLSEAVRAIAHCAIHDAFEGCVDVAAELHLRALTRLDARFSTISPEKFIELVAHAKKVSRPASAATKWRTQYASSKLQRQLFEAAGGFSSWATTSPTAEALKKRRQRAQRRG